MLLPAYAKARGISPSTLPMTPGCRPEDICHCVPGGGAHGSSLGPTPTAAARDAALQGRPGQASPPTAASGPWPAGVLKGASSQTRPQSWSGVRTPGLAPVASAT